MFGVHTEIANRPDQDHKTRPDPKSERKRIGGGGKGKNASSERILLASLTEWSAVLGKKTRPSLGDAKHGFMTEKKSKPKGITGLRGGGYYDVVANRRREPETNWHIAVRSKEKRSKSTKRTPLKIHPFGARPTRQRVAAHW